MDFLRRFMAGRYGSDQLNNAFLLLACVLMVIEWVLGWRWMSVFILALLLLCYFRMFSRNIQARYSENQKFLRYWGPLSRRLHNACCASATVRPIGTSNARTVISACACRRAGKITITCPHCRTQFVRKAEKKEEAFGKRQKCVFGAITGTDAPGKTQFAGINAKYLLQFLQNAV